MKKHFSIKVSGVVQGVFFRASTKAQADALDIKGLVRNEPDGSVYIEAEGDEHNLDAFVQWCRKGPPRASVEKCQIEERPAKGYGKFTIER
jgi:acylphosphatase